MSLVVHTLLKISLISNKNLNATKFNRKQRNNKIDIFSIIS